jgi:hypothetical protein
MRIIQKSLLFMIMIKSAKCLEFETLSSSSWTRFMALVYILYYVFSAVVMSFFWDGEVVKTQTRLALCQATLVSTDEMHLPVPSICHSLRRARLNWTLSHCGGISSCNVRWHKINPPFSMPDVCSPTWKGKINIHRHSARDYGTSECVSLVNALWENTLFFIVPREREMGARTIWMIMVVMVCLLPSNAIVWQIINAARSRWQWTQIRLWWSQIENLWLKMNLNPTPLLNIIHSNLKVWLSSLHSQMESI